MDATQDKRMVRLVLTEDQKQKVRASTGLTADAIELTIEELEERINPGFTQNHNEAFLTDE